MFDANPAGTEEVMGIKFLCNLMRVPVPDRRGQQRDRSEGNYAKNCGAFEREPRKPSGLTQLPDNNVHQRRDDNDARDLDKQRQRNRDCGYEE